MAKCSVCGRRAIYVARYEGKAYCEEHFLEWFDKRVRKTIRKFSFFGPKEKIVVAVSGGKDSLSALHYLVNLSKHVPGWEIKALLVDEGIRGYRDVTIRDFKRVAEELGVDYRIVGFKEVIGASLDEIVKIGMERGLPYKPCTYCGVFRRYILNRAAREMDATVLVTAHNLDDVVQTFVMNLLRNDWEKISRLGPVSGSGDHPKFVRKVKLFYEIPEKEIVIYALLNDIFPETFVECPYARFGMRWEVRRAINAWEEKYPGTKYALLRSLLEILPLLRERYRGTPKTCKICGEPSTGDVCRACQLRMELGLLDVQV